MTSCFTALLDEPLNTRDAVFLLTISEVTTSVFYTLSTDSPELIISYFFSGYFRFCADFTVFGDDDVGGSGRIVINVTAREPFDRVNFSNGTEALIINVFDDDGAGKLT